MKPLILHVGMPKTGTTSIQSTFFWHPPADPFRFLTLDTVFGNRMVSTACYDEHSNQRNYFTATLSRRRLDRYKKQALHYLSESLITCARQGLTPVLSAEAAWLFHEGELTFLKSMASRHGFTARVIAYIRPPLDLAESMLQQNVKVGHAPRITDILSRAFASLSQIERLESVFGPDQVSLFIYDPRRFPGQCVVRHFSAATGINQAHDRIMRENDGVNANIVKFLYLWNLRNPRTIHSRFTRLRRAMVLAALRELSGPPLRFSPRIAESLIPAYQDRHQALAARFGRELPITVIPRTSGEEIETQEDLMRYSDDAMRWLSENASASFAGSRSSRDQHDIVFRQINMLARVRAPGMLARYVWCEIKVRRQRLRMRRQLLRRS